MIRQPLDPNRGDVHEAHVFGVLGKHGRERAWNNVAQAWTSGCLARGERWNDPGYKLTDLSWATIIINTIVGTGAFLVAAIVFGIAFGGLRVITKTFVRQDF